MEEKENLKQYLENQVCLCGSSNFKCFEFEGITIILVCNDCGRFEFINNENYSGIINFSDSNGIVFCEWNKDYPFFVYDDKNNDIKQVRGTSWISRNKLAKKIVYQIPSNIAIKQYKFIIHQKTKDLMKLKRDFKKYTLMRGNEK